MLSYYNYYIVTLTIKKDSYYLERERNSYYLERNSYYLERNSYYLERNSYYLERNSYFHEIDTFIIENITMQTLRHLHHHRRK